VRRRVVVTGLGPVSSIGIGIASFKAALRAGRNGIAPVTAFDASGFPHKHAGEVTDFEPAAVLRRVDPADWGRTSQFAAAAARLAAEDAGLGEELRGPRAGACVGTTSGESAVIEQLTAQWVDRGLPHLDGRLVRQVPAWRLALAVIHELGMTGEAMTLSTACSASNYAIGYAADLVAHGDMDVMIAAGADSVCRWAHAGFYRLGALSDRTCAPFDRDRTGILTGEGGAALVLEPLEAAVARGARIYAEVLGYALNCDAHHMVAPDATSIAECARRAHRNAGVHAEDVDYICAHGTGTQANDATEVAAMLDVFTGDPPPISSIKSMLGHTMGAASGFGAIACALGIADSFVPPTMNFRTPDPAMEGIDPVPNVVREVPVRVAQNNGFAFGGNNAITVLGDLAVGSARNGAGPAGGERRGTLAIVGWSMVSSLGVELEHFVEGVREGRSGEVDTTGMFDVPLPAERAFALRDLSIREQLGRKGTSALDRTGALAICATGRALASAKTVVDDDSRARIGLVLGTSTGSVRSTVEYSRETLVNPRPYLVNPSLFPNTVMNCAAGRSAIWHGLKGPNATVAGGQLSSLQALRYARNALRTGAADVLVVGGVEEMSPQSAWAQHRATAARDAAAPGEGCGAFVVERAADVRTRGGDALAELLAVETASAAAGPDGGAASIARCVRHALHESGVAPEDVSIVSASACGAPALDDAERDGVLEELGDRPLRWLRIKEQVGECYSAAGALQLGAVLAQPLAPGEVALVTSLAWDGSAAAAVVRGWRS
jgi:3-oxoacyl-[acyl-carrier-protein] synthase II